MVTKRFCDACGSECINAAPEMRVTGITRDQAPSRYCVWDLCEKCRAAVRNSILRLGLEVEE